MKYYGLISGEMFRKAGRNKMLGPIKKMLMMSSAIIFCLLSLMINHVYSIGDPQSTNTRLHIYFYDTNPKTQTITITEAKILFWKFDFSLALTQRLPINTTFIPASFKVVGNGITQEFLQSQGQVELSPGTYTLTLFGGYEEHNQQNTGDPGRSTGKAMGKAWVIQHEDGVVYAVDCSEKFYNDQFNVMLPQKTVPSDSFADLATGNGQNITIPTSQTADIMDYPIRVWYEFGYGIISGGADHFNYPWVKVEIYSKDGVLIQTQNLTSRSGYKDIPAGTWAKFILNNGNRYYTNVTNNHHYVGGYPAWLKLKYKFDDARPETLQPVKVNLTRYNGVYYTSEPEIPIKFTTVNDRGVIFNGYEEKSEIKTYRIQACEYPGLGDYEENNNLPNSCSHQEYPFVVDSDSSTANIELNRAIYLPSSNKKYYLKVIAVDRAGLHSYPSEEIAIVCLTGKPNSPDKPVVNGLTDHAHTSQSKITWMWNEVTDPCGLGIKEYRVLVEKDGVPVGNGWINLGLNTDYTFTVPEGQDGEYRCRVKAVNFGGIEGDSSNPGTIIVDRVVPKVSLPAYPIRMNGTASLFSWEPIVDVSNIDHYEIALSQSGDSPVLGVKTVGNQLSYMFTDLDWRTQYYAWVRGIDGLGNVGPWTRVGPFPDMKFFPDSNISYTNKSSQIFAISSLIGKTLKARIKFNAVGSTDFMVGSHWSLCPDVSFEEGEWEWRLEICETDDLGNPIEASLQTTPAYRIKIDRTVPTGMFFLKSGDGNKVFDTVNNPSNSRQVRLVVNELYDGIAYSSGVKGAYFWNGDNPTRPMDSDNYTFKSLSELNSSEGFLWMLSEGEDGIRKVTMQIEDQAGNTGIVTYSVRLDRSISGIPGNFAHSFTAQEDYLVFSWSMGNTEEVRCFTGEYSLPDGTKVPFNNVIPTQQGDTYQGSFAVSIKNLGPNLPVFIRVNAVDKAGNYSADSPVYFAFTKAKLGSLENLPGGYDYNTKQHCLQWRLITTQSQAENHILEYGTLNEQGFDVQGILTPDSNGVFTLSGLVAHDRIFFRLVALNGSSPSDRTVGVVYSRQVVNELPSPFKLNGPKIFGGIGFSFSFGDSQDVDGDILTYQVYVKGEDDQVYTPYTSDYPFLHGKTYYWYVVAYDGHDGSTSSETVGKFTADFKPPVLEVHNPVGEFTNQSILKLVTYDELSGIDKVTYQKAPGEQIVSELALGVKDDRFIGEISLPEGTYNYIITAVDKAGNHTTVNVNNLKVDRTTPILSHIQLDLPQSDGRYMLGRDQAILHWTATDDASGIKKMIYQVVKRSGDPMDKPKSIDLPKNLPNYQYGLEITGQDGNEYYLAIAITDRAGNMSPLQYVGPILVDKTPPQLNINITGYHTCGSTFYLSTLSGLACRIICNDPETGVHKPEFAVQNSQNIIVVDWSSWDDLTKTTLQPGRYRVICRVLNEAGLESDTQSPWFIYDNTPPLALNVANPSHALLQGEQAIFTVSAEENESVISRYLLAIGTTPGGNDISALVDGNQNGWVVMDSSLKTQLLRVVIPQTSSGSYYVTLRVDNGAGLSAIVQAGSIIIDNAQERVVVMDQGPFTMFADRLVGSWKYNGAKTVREYQYQIVDLENNSISNWITTTDDWGQLNGLKLEQGKTYRFRVKAFLSDGGEATGESPGITVDLTPPMIESFITPAYSTSSNLRFRWSGQEDISGLAKVQVALGSDYGQLDITSGWVDVTANDSGVNCKADGTELELNSGERYYLSLRITNGAGLIGEICSPAIIIDDSPPPIPRVSDQGSYLNMVQDLTANWIWSSIDMQSGVTFQWTILDNTCSISPETVWHQDNDTRKAVLNIADYPRLDGHTYYFAVKATNGAGLTSIGFSDGIIVDASVPYIPEVTLKQAVNLGQDETDVTYITSLSNLELWIDSIDPESGINGYRYAYGPEDLVDTAPETASSDAINPLYNPLIEEGILTLFKGECFNGADLKSQPGYSSGVVLDTGSPKVVNVHGGLVGCRMLFDWSVIVGNNGGKIHSPVAWYEVALVPEELMNEEPDSWIKVGLTPFISIDVKNMRDGYYRLLVRACNQAGTYSRRDGVKDEWGVSQRMIIDHNAPQMTPEGFKYPRYVSEEITVKLSATDNLSGIGGYQYALGNPSDPFLYTRGWVDLNLKEGSVEFSISTRDISQGARVILMVRAKDGVGLWSDTQISQVIMIDHTESTTPIITVGNYTRLSNEISGITFFAQDYESGIIQYRLGVVKEGGESPITIQEQAIEDFRGSITGLVLEEGQSYRLWVQVKNGAGIWSKAGYSSLITMDSTVPVLSFTRETTTIVLNNPPINIGFSVSESCVVHFSLTDERDGSTKTFEQSCQAGLNDFVFQEELPGRYRLAATITDLAGNMGIAERPQTIRINTPPTISLSSMVNSAQGVVVVSRGAPVNFIVSISDPDGDNQQSFSYRWKTGVTDETVFTEYSPTYRYRNLGEYTLELTVTDQDGGTAMTSIKIIVGNTTYGTLYQDETWSGIHHVTGDVIVPVGIKLNIAPGTTIIVDEGLTITVKGFLLNSSGSQVNIKSAQSGLWKGLYIEGQALLQFVMIEGAVRGLTATETAEVTLRNCAFQSNDVGLHVWGSRPLVEQCSFLNNTLYGVKEDEGGSPIMLGCLFTGNGNDYYQDDETLITLEQLNQIAGNAENHQ